MAHPLELAYNWRTPVLVSTVGLVLFVLALVRTAPPGWVSAAAVLTGCWVLFLVVVWLRTRAFLSVDGSTLTVRRWRGRHRIEAGQLVKVAESMTPSGASYRLTVRQADGRVRRRVAPTALLRRGHSTLFAWILTWAPGAELDRGSQRTLADLQDRGLVPTRPDRQQSTAVGTDERPASLLEARRHPDPAEGGPA